MDLPLHYQFKLVEVTQIYAKANRKQKLTLLAQQMLLNRRLQAFASGQAFDTSLAQAVERIEQTEFDVSVLEFELSPLSDPQLDERFAEAVKLGMLTRQAFADMIKAGEIS